jgi:hypothetical protein
MTQVKDSLISPMITLLQCWHCSEVDWQKRQIRGSFLGKERVENASNKGIFLRGLLWVTSGTGFGFT